jgi:hypothetical protein
MPAGSRIEGKAGVATLHYEGRVDELRIKAGEGEIHAEQLDRQPSGTPAAEL